jgi:type III secretory pathway component EscT
MQANAVVMMRFDSSEMGQTMSEVVAYGTAVIIALLMATVGLWLLSRQAWQPGIQVVGAGSAAMSVAARRDNPGIRPSHNA